VWVVWVVLGGAGPRVCALSVRCLVFEGVSMMVMDRCGLVLVACLSGVVGGWGCVPVFAGQSILRRAV